MSDGRMAVLGLAVPLCVVAGYWLWDPVVIPESIESDTSLVERESDGLGAGSIDDDRDSIQESRASEVIPPPTVSENATLPVERPELRSEPVPAAEDQQPVVSETPLRVRTYTVKAGDTLSGISFREYGSSRYVDLIFEANRDLLPSKNALAVGQSLVLPELSVASE